MKEQHGETNDFLDRDGPVSYDSSSCMTKVVCLENDLDAPFVDVTCSYSFNILQ